MTVTTPSGKIRGKSSTYLYLVLALCEGYEIEELPRDVPGSPYASSTLMDSDRDVGPSG